MKKHIVTYLLENKNITGRLAILSLTLMLSLTSFGQNTQNVQSLLTESWGGNPGDWQNLNKNIYSYDSNGYMTNDLTLKWDIPSSTMQNLKQNNYVNNPDGTVSQMITQSWDNVSGSWGNSAKYSYTYNSSNNVQSLLEESWITGNWQNESMTTYTYTDNHLTNSIKQIWYVQSLSWHNYNQLNYTYDINGNVTIMTSQYYYNDIWANSTRNSYTYNTQNQVLINYENAWSNGGWWSSRKYVNSYASGILYNTLSYSYTVPSQFQMLIGQNNYTNNSNGTVSQLVSQTWTATSSSTGYYTNSRRLTYNYDPELAITDFENQNSVTIYPNPTTDIVNVKTNDNHTGLPYSIIDQSGRLVLTGKLNKEETAIDITQLTKGVYLLQTQNHQIKTVKLIKK